MAFSLVYSLWTIQRQLDCEIRNAMWTSLVFIALLLLDSNVQCVDQYNHTAHGLRFRYYCSSLVVSHYQFVLNVLFQSHIGLETNRTCLFKPYHRAYIFTQTCHESAIYWSQCYQNCLIHWHISRNLQGAHDYDSYHYIFLEGQWPWSSCLKRNGQLTRLFNYAPWTFSVVEIRASNPSYHLQCLSAIRFLTTLIQQIFNQCIIFMPVHIFQ